jgi:hypothetical protein
MYNMVYVVFIIYFTVPKDRSLIGQMPYTYLQVRGACHQPVSADTVIEQVPLSLTSCRYQCDLQPACKAVVYYDHIDDHCLMLNSLCQIDMSILASTTYVKAFNESGKFAKRCEYITLCYLSYCYLHEPLASDVIDSPYFTSNATSQISRCSF